MESKDTEDSGIDISSIREVFKRERPESVALSPFVFKKVSLKHIEVDAELTLKFRKSTNLDHQQLREELGKSFDEQMFTNLDVVAMTDLAFRFLSKESKKEIAAIQFTDIDDDGEEVVKTIPLKEKMKLIFISDIYSINELLNLLLNIFGYTKDLIDKIFVEAEKSKKKAQPQEEPPPTPKPT